MDIIPQSPALLQSIRESTIIRRFQAQRASELDHLRGFARLIHRWRIYRWARKQAIPEILAERKKIPRKFDRRLV